MASRERSMVPPSKWSDCCRRLSSYLLFQNTLGAITSSRDNLDQIQAKRDCFLKLILTNLFRKLSIFQHSCARAPTAFSKMVRLAAPRHVCVRGFARVVGAAAAGFSGQKCLG